MDFDRGTEAAHSADRGRMSKDSIRRPTEREVMRKHYRERGGRSMDGKDSKKISGGDALTGHTRSHTEHEG